MGLKSKDLLGMKQLTPEEIMEILDTAKTMKLVISSANKKTSHLQGKSVVTLFYENSTRTRLSFELASKYMAISAYNGLFSLSRLKEFGVNEERIKAALDFCISEGLMEKCVGDRYKITMSGFKYYGAVFSLFYA